MALPSYSQSLITCVAKAPQSFTLPSYVIGGTNNSAYRLMKIGTTYSFAVWRSPVYRLGKQFDIMKIQFPVYPAVTTNMTIIPVLYFDNAASSSTGTTINSTNYSGAKEITLYPPNFSNAIRGNNNFFLELQFSGSALAVVGLPIYIDIDEHDF